MTSPPSNGNGRKIDRSTAVSLGLAVAMSIGATTFALRVPTSDTMKVIVNDAIQPLEDKLNAALIEMARLRILEERVRRLEEKGE